MNYLKLISVLFSQDLQRLVQTFGDYLFLTNNDIKKLTMAYECTSTIFALISTWIAQTCTNLNKVKQLQLGMNFYTIFSKPA